MLPSKCVSYYVYFGQILRFLRICSGLEDFKERCIFLTRLLQDRGYQNTRLASKFNEVLYRHKKIGSSLME